MKTLLSIVLLAFCSAVILSVAHAPAAVSAAQLSQDAQTIYCASDDMGRNSCEVDTRGGVQLVRQRSGSPCTFGRTWGYDNRGIWVDKGCRADFELGSANYKWGGGYNDNANYIIYCASDDGDHEFCPAYTRHGVRLVRQRSGSECIYGRTWGYGRHGVWVDQGCRADFQIGYAGWNGGETQIVNCSSEDMGLHYCRTDTSRGVQLVRQRSESDCVYGRTWGHDDRGIWVDRGCRADFQIGGDDDDWEGNDPYPNVRIYCASDDGHRHSCYADTRGGIRMANQRSGSPCIEGKTWGYDNKGVWVDKGCRADFEAGSGNRDRGPYPPAGPVTKLNCSSEDGKKHYCAADTRRGVRMVNQRSGSPCLEGKTWGYDNNGVWVDKGCRADFEVGNGDGDRGAYPPSGAVTKLNCSSEDGKKHYCAADTRGGIRMVNQRSGSPCVEGKTWGYDSNGVWVDRGCRADFEIGGSY